jgi:hypothetical protein
MQDAASDPSPPGAAVRVKKQRPYKKYCPVGVKLLDHKLHLLNPKTHLTGGIAYGHGRLCSPFPRNRESVDSQFLNRKRTKTSRHTCKRIKLPSPDVGRSAPSPKVLLLGARRVGDEGRQNKFNRGDDARHANAHARVHPL